MKSIEFNDNDYSQLPLFIKKYWGFKVEFDNGCILFLKDDALAIWGCTPYGIDWCCNHNDGWIVNVISWLVFWNDSRDEHGYIMD